MINLMEAAVAAEEEVEEEEEEEAMTILDHMEVVAAVEEVVDPLHTEVNNSTFLFQIILKLTKHFS